MAYTPNATWTSSTVITSAKLDNLETIYDESYSYFTAHNHDDLYPTKAECDALFWSAATDGPGSGADCDLLYKSGGNLHAASFYGLGVPTGIIILWYGATGAIPSGWALCNGSGGTVDLRGRFVVGAGNTYNPGTTGGSATFTASGTITVDAHVLSIDEMGAHLHPFTDKTPTQGSYPDQTASGYNHCLAGSTTSSGNTSSAGSGSGHGHSSAEGTAMTGNAVASLPRYYALAYIQKTA
jgi:hypothetical protein